MAGETTGVLLHYSEDATITRFVPHVPPTNPTQRAAVWAIDAAHAPLYWFPRDCPRVTVWANDDDQARRLADRFDTTARRVQAAPARWEPRVRATVLYEYQFDPAPFAPWADAEGQWIAHEPVSPVAVAAVGDLVERQHAAGVDLRFVADLAPLRDLVLTGDLPFSIVRWSNRDPAP
jgi:hypothetical protein